MTKECVVPSSSGDNSHIGNNIFYLEDVHNPINAILWKDGWKYSNNIGLVGDQEKGMVGFHEYVALLFHQTIELRILIG